MRQTKIKSGLLWAASLLCTGCWDVGQGEKIGQVVKINEKSGYFCKTVEVEIVRGGFTGGSGVNGTSLRFTVEKNRKAAVELLKAAMLNGDEIQVKYHQEHATWCRSDSNDLFGDEITLVKKDTNSCGKTESKKDAILNALILQNEALKKLINSPDRT